MEHLQAIKLCLYSIGAIKEGVPLDIVTSRLDRNGETRGEGLI